MFYKSMFLWHNAETVESSNISMVMIAISEAVQWLNLDVLAGFLQPLP